MFKTVETNQNFIEMEKKWLKQWYEKATVNKYLHKNDKAKKTFSFLDGPITANNPMGIHHAWGRTYKDLWQKFYNLLGYRERFQNGFDCQGLWVEVEVEKELGLRSKKDIENLVPGDKKASIAKFVELCKQRVLKFAGIQTEQSKRLGYFMDWDRSYFTMSEENNYMIWHFLKTCYKNGWVYKGHESVPWCPRCETAISQHEMLTEDYKELTHKSVVLKFPIKNNEYLLAWTTTPWSIPGTIGLMVNPQFDYVKVKQQNNIYILAKERLEILKDQYKIIEEFKGNKLVGLTFTHPYQDFPALKGQKFPVIPSEEYVTSDVGTGIVTNNPGVGQEDYLAAKKVNLKPVESIDESAHFLENYSWLTGKYAKQEKLIDEILNDLTKRNFVYDIFKFKHRYPICWRCKTELVFRVADEWYIAMDKPSNVGNGLDRSLRKRMIDVAKKIHWMPEFGLDRELDWLKNMHDWLISKKNRYWGLALPIYECKKCKTFEIIGSKEELKKRAVKGWAEFESHTPHKPYIDEVVIKCSKCDSEVKRIDDVGNPWLDAGIVPYSTITEKNKGEPLYLKDKSTWKQWFPVDFITESFPGQFKNWFYSLIAMSTVLENENPFKTVLGFGTLFGEDGRPMHKSWGNSIEFNEGADTIGVDVMRWMYTRTNPADNLLFGYKRASEVKRQFYLMLWNIYKFFVEYANLDKFDIKRHSGKPKAHPESMIHKTMDAGQASMTNILDRWILNRFYELAQSITDNLKEYNAKDASLDTEEFVQDLSTWYIRRSRDRVWINSDSPEDKNNFYSTLYFILRNLSLILSPFMPFITEEIYTNLTDSGSVHLSSWPDFAKVSVDKKLIENMRLLRNIAEVGHRVRKELKLKVRQPLNKAIITMNITEPFSEEKSQFEDLLKSELNIKIIEWQKKKTEEIQLTYDTIITPELKKEGDLREIIRQIQAERKKLGAKQDEYVKISIPKEFEDNLEFIKRRVLAKTIDLGEKLIVTKS